ncbi:Eukaryotic translation initiation factor 4E [Apodemus speciosus]|uniref:Eukaryotic translation initiation factor 4E n=1 Tax=Apodemus speciosus TaxID=105296 RepID=A0ABQ0EMQ2_APOSI
METTPTTNPPPAEEEKTESNQEVANPEHYIKHPLQNRWALWFFKNDKSKTWQANLRLISKFDTVEDFWDGIEPMWEDEKNKRGGRWLITLNKQQRRSDLDRFWLETTGFLCIDQAGLELRNPPASASKVLGLKACATTAPQISNILKQRFNHAFREEYDYHFGMLLLCLIGESFDDYSDDVCGAVVNVRAKGDKIAIWTTECENRDAVTHIGEGIQGKVRTSSEDSNWLSVPRRHSYKERLHH